MTGNGNRKKTKAKAYSADVIALRLVGGMTLIALGCIIFLAVDLNVAGENGIFTGLKDICYGVSGRLAPVLAVFPVWGGILLAISAQRKAPNRPFVFACLAFLFLCAFMTATETTGRPVESLMEYLSHSVSRDDFGGYLYEGYMKGEQLFSGHGGGGVVGMILGWPLWRLFNSPVLCAILTMLGLIAMILLALSLTPSRIKTFLTGKGIAMRQNRQQEQVVLDQRQMEMQREEAIRQQQANYAAQQEYARQQQEYNRRQQEYAMLQEQERLAREQTARQMTAARESMQTPAYPLQPELPDPVENGTYREHIFDGTSNRPPKEEKTGFLSRIFRKNQNDGLTDPDSIGNRGQRPQPDRERTGGRTDHGQRSRIFAGETMGDERDTRDVRTSRPSGTDRETNRGTDWQRTRQETSGDRTRPAGRPRPAEKGTEEPDLRTDRRYPGEEAPEDRAFPVNRPRPAGKKTGDPDLRTDRRYPGEEAPEDSAFPGNRPRPAVKRTEEPDLRTDRRYPGEEAPEDSAFPVNRPRPAVKRTEEPDLRTDRRYPGEDDPEDSAFPGNRPRPAVKRTGDPDLRTDRRYPGEDDPEDSAFPVNRPRPAEDDHEGQDLHTGRQRPTEEENPAERNQPLPDRKSAEGAAAQAENQGSHASGRERGRTRAEESITLSGRDRIPADGDENRAASARTGNDDREREAVSSGESANPIAPWQQQVRDALKETEQTASGTSDRQDPEPQRPEQQRASAIFTDMTIPKGVTSGPEGSWKPELKLPPRKEVPEEEEEEPQEPPYIFPPIELISLPKEEHTDTSEEDAMRARILEETLESFRVRARVVNVTHGPAISRFELQLEAGIKVNKITELVNDIAMNMEATSVRIEAPIPGKSLVGVEVPNRKVTPVTLREVLESEQMHAAKSSLSVALGKDIAGTPIICDLARMPHLLIAGATGSGKSVCINTIINSLLYRCTPEDVRLILVDPKVVELQCYNKVPHLLVPVVNDPHKAAAALAWAVAEMMSRYDRFAERMVRNIDGYNANLEPGEKRMARIVIIIDELADLMMVCKKDVEDYICRLTQLARAAGIHLIVATQRPSVDVITGLIKANIPSRIAFKTASSVDSRTILDKNGSEQLLGWGDMLYLPTGAFMPTRIQGCFLSDGEVTKITDFIEETCPRIADPDILEKMDEFYKKNQESPSADLIGGTQQEDGGGDAGLLEQCIEMTVQEGQISTSTIQRRLKIGYARAGRLTDEMEARGIVSAKDGSKPRKCLISREEWEQMKQNTQEE